MSFGLFIVGAAECVVAAYSVYAQDNYGAGTWHLILGFLLFYLADQNKD